MLVDVQRDVAQGPGDGGTEAAAGTVTAPTPIGEFHDDSLPGRLAALGASALLTLAVVAVALALTAAESSDENRLLVAIGSPPSIRRSVSAWQATLLPAIALVVAVPIALAVAAVTRARRAAPTTSWSRGSPSPCWRSGYRW